MRRRIKRNFSMSRFGRQRRRVVVRQHSFELKPWYKRLPVWRALEVLGIAAALWALWVTIEANELAREGIEQSRIVSAWQVVTTKAPGNSGKREALETLNKAGQPLNGIDLSCKSMGGYDDEAQQCVRRVYLYGVQLEGAELNRANLSEVDLEDANLSGAELNRANLSEAKLWYANLSVVKLYRANFSGAMLEDANLSGAQLRAANLSGAQLGAANLSGAQLRAANLSGADLWSANLSEADLWSANLSGAMLENANLSGTRLWEVDLSGAEFCNIELGCAQNLTQDQINQAWAWADRPQSFSDGQHKLDLTNPPLCDPKLRPQYEADKETGRPHGC